MSNYDPSSLSPFLEGQKNTVHWTEVSMSFSNGTNTSNFDRFRQGIELTSPRHYYSGFAKIHSGEENHFIKQNTFGQGKLKITSLQRFEEVDNFNPISYIQFDHIIDQTTLLRVYRNTFPIVVSDIDRFEFLNGDGAIEPFTIRAKASNYSIEVPFFAHDIKASLIAGNLNYKFSSDQIVVKYNKKTENNETNYFDCVDTSGGGAPLVGYVSPEIALISPHDDVKLKSGIKITSNMGNDLKNALYDMNPIDDSYLGADTIALSTGFISDYGRYGIDSIAFNGLTSKNTQMYEEIDL